MFKSDLAQHSFVLAEAAICERLRRIEDVELHPTLFNAPMIYDPAMSDVLAGMYREYIEIAREMDVPILIAAPTWRLDAEKVAAAGVPDIINADAVAFIQKVKNESGYDAIYVAGLLAAKNDSYDFNVALPVDEAEEFHSVQAAQLARASVDCLIAQTIPSVEEAEGMARAMLATGVPSMIGFCINSQGRVLDGTPLEDAIKRLDDRLDSGLLGYTVNCSHPTFVPTDTMSADSLSRLIGISANSSSKDHCELEASTRTFADSREQWADAMVRLNREFGVKILGGCCGTDDRYLRAICERMEGCDLGEPLP
jgi:homocysteine S-methyltransferase